MPNEDITLNVTEECLEGLGKTLQGKDPDFTVTEAVIREASDSHVCVAWDTKSAGFGELTLYREKGLWKADTECMSRGFAKAVAKLIDSVIVVGEVSE